MQSVFGLSIIIGRVVVGYLVDRLWAPGVAAFCLAIPAAGAAMLYGSQSFEAAALAAFLIGFAAGAELDLMAFLAARYFGLGSLRQDLLDSVCHPGRLLGYRTHDFRLGL